MDSDTINFFHRDQPYGFMSNFYLAPFEAQGKKYASSEHYFQSKKFEGHPYELQIIAASTSDKAFDMGQSRDHPLRKDWSQVKQKVMMEGLNQKIRQNPHLKQQLLATGTKKIIEHTEQDSYWGDGGDGSGLNRLGQLYMTLRDQLNKQKNPS